jgi:hypothetical protein
MEMKHEGPGTFLCTNEKCAVSVCIARNNDEDALAILNAPVPTPKTCQQPSWKDVYRTDVQYPYYTSQGIVRGSGGVDTGWREEDIT